jgi:hypothetical protein
MQKILLFLCLVAVLPACTFTSSSTSSTTTEKRTLAIAEKIHNNTSFDVTVYPDTESYIEITGPTDIVKRITNKINDGIVEIDMKGNFNFINETVEIAIHTPKIGELHVNGSGGIRVQNKFSGEAKSFSARVNGSGSLKVLMNTPSIDAVLAGSGDMEIVGETRNLNLTVKGSGNYSGYNLLSENTFVQVSGSGNAKVYGSNHIEATINGSGNITYIGTNNINKTINGSGEIIKGNEKE